MQASPFAALALLAIGCQSQPALVRPIATEPPAVSEARLDLNDAITALNEGELELGIDLCEDALAAAGDDGALRGEAHAWLVHAYALCDDPDSGLEHAALGIELQPKNAWLRYSQGVALQKLGLFDDAIDSFSHAIRLDPNHIKALQWRAHVLQGQELFEDSIEDWTRAIAIIEAADADALASWGGNREELIATCVRARGECEDALAQ